MIWYILTGLALMISVSSQLADNSVLDWLNNITLEQSVAHSTGVQNTTESEDDTKVNLDPIGENRREACVSENGEMGVCVMHYQCDPTTRSVIKDGATIIDVRFQDSCPNILEVCCKETNVNNSTRAGQNEDTKNNGMFYTNEKLLSLLIVVFIMLL